MFQTATILKAMQGYQEYFLLLKNRVTEKKCSSLQSIRGAGVRGVFVRAIRVEDLQTH